MIIKRQSRANKAAIARKRVRTKWKKGHSSDSNPSIATFRNAVRKLTITDPNDLEHLLPSVPVIEDESMNDDVDTASICSAESRISHFTNCTNPTFNKVHRIWKSGSSIQKDVLAVLASVTEIIKSSDGKETEVEYFAALLSTLSSTVDQPELLAATSYLLSLVVHKVPVTILQRRFGPASQVIGPIIGVLQDQESGSASSSESLRATCDTSLRYLIVTLGTLLAAQRRAAWIEQPVIPATLDAVLNGSFAHRKPRVRKAVIKMVSNVVCRRDVIPVVAGNDPPPSALVHPAAKQIAEFCARQMEKNGGTGPAAKKTLAALNLLAPVFHRLPAASLKQMCETLLRLLTLANAVVRLACYNALYCLFHFKPDPLILTNELCGQLILALYDFQPPLNDVKAGRIWVQTVGAAHICLSESDDLIGLETLPKYMQVIYTLLQSCSPEIHQLAVQETINVIEHGLKRFKLEPERVEKHSSVLNALLISVAEVLKYQYFAIWPKPFYILGALFGAIGPHCAGLPAFKHVVVSLVNLRETDTVTFKSELEQTIGMAISEIGLEPVLQIVSLGLDPNSPQVSVDFQRSWIIPVIRKFAKMSKNSRLASFEQHVLPLAVRVKQKARALEADGQKTEARIYSTFELQLWDLLPSVAKSPEDLKEGMTSLGKIIGTAILQRPDLRVTLMSALRNLIVSSKEEAAERGENTMADYAKNYLPILFNLYTDPKHEGEVKPECQKEVKSAVLDVIRLYLSIASEALLRQYLNAALNKVDEKTDIWDILVSITPCLSPADLSPLFQKVQQTLSPEEQTTGAKPTDQSVIKKSYRVLQEIVLAYDKFDVFILENWEAILGLVKLNCTEAAPATKAARMSALAGLAVSPASKLSDLTAFAVTEAVYGLKEKSSKARKTAAKSLVSIVGHLAEHSDEDLDAVLQKITLWLQDGQFFSPNKPRSLTGALIAIRLMIFEYQKQIGSSVLALWLGEICNCVRVNNRMVVEAALQCLTTMAGKLSPVLLGPFLDLILSAAYSQNEECQRHFRFLTRKLLVKLVKKFGAEILAKHVPAEHQCHLNYVRRMLARRQKKMEDRKNPNSDDKDKDSDKATDIGSLSTMASWTTKPESIGELLQDSDSDDEMDDDVEHKTTRSTVRSKAMPIWLQEAADEAPLDLLSSRDVAGKVLTSNPKTTDKKPLFKTEKDADKSEIGGFKLDRRTGKIIISLDEEEPKVDRGSKRQRKHSEGNSTAKKRKMEENDSDKEDEDLRDRRPRSTTGADSNKYRPGGKGIHRDRSKGPGDTSRNDGMQPFAYMPLNRSVLNRRKQKKNEGQFKGIVKGARKGAKVAAGKKR